MTLGAVSCLLLKDKILLVGCCVRLHCMRCFCRFSAALCGALSCGQPDPAALRGALSYGQPDPVALCGALSYGQPDPAALCGALSFGQPDPAALCGGALSHVFVCAAFCGLVAVGCLVSRLDQFPAFSLFCWSSAWLFGDCLCASQRISCSAAFCPPLPVYHAPMLVCN
jgi:hypothetical protein